MCIHINFQCYCVFQNAASIKVSFCYVHIYSFDAAGSLHCLATSVSHIVCRWSTRTFAVWKKQDTQISGLGSAAIPLQVRRSPFAYMSTRHFCLIGIYCCCSTPSCSIPSGLKCLVYKIEWWQKYRDVLLNILEYKKLGYERMVKFQFCDLL